MREVTEEGSRTRRFLVHSPERKRHERKLRRKEQEKVRKRLERLCERVAGGEFQRRALKQWKRRAAEAGREERQVLSEFSCRVDPRLLPQCTHAWLNAVHELGLPGGSSFDLDFHTVPYHGRKAFLQQHYVSKRSRSQRGVLTFLVRDAREDTFCFIDATVRKEDQNQAVLRFVDAHRERTGQLPEELVFDSRRTTHAVLARLRQLGIGFLTLRRRSPRMVRELLVREDWKRVTLHNIGRQYRHPRVLDQTVKLRGYPVSIRQLAVTELGHERPTLLLTN